MRHLLLLVLAFGLTSCDVFGGGEPTFDLTFFDAEGEAVARLKFDEPDALPCDALDCNEADWRLIEGDKDNPVTFGRTRGTLRAGRTAEGWSLDLTPPDVVDAGTIATVEVAEDGRVTGAWFQNSVGGPIPSGDVTGRVE